MYVCVGIGAHTPHAVHFCQGTSVCCSLALLFVSKSNPLSRALGARAQTWHRLC